MSTTLTQANREWASRPQDERFKNLHALHEAVQTRRRNSIDSERSMSNAHVTVNGSMVLDCFGMPTQRLTNWSAGQLCAKLGVPRDLLAKLDPDTATMVMNDRLPKAIAEGKLNQYQRVLIDDDRGVIRAFHGKVYNRVWDADVTRTLLEYLPPGWRNPVAYANGKWGSALEPSGLYAGDRNLFAFFIDGGDWREDQPDAGSFDVDGEKFNRGFFVENSEVGADTLKYTTFFFDVVCGNHYVWGARDVLVESFIHRGKVATRGLYQFREFLNRLNENNTVEGFREAVRAAKQVIAVPVTRDKVETLDAAFGKFKSTFTQNEITLALDAMLREEKGVTGTRYDWLAGFTAVARELPNADDRCALEMKASKLLLTYPGTTK